MTMCATPLTVNDVTLRLTVSKATALRHLKLRVEQGVAIRRRRVRYVEDLTEVREEKAAWVQAYTDVLRQMFQGEAGAVVADGCNDWVGRVYPEYAETELFVEQFYEEMEYRITRLRELARHVAGMPEVVPVPPASSTAASLIAPAEATLDTPRELREAPKHAPAAAGAAPAAAATAAAAPAAAKRDEPVDAPASGAAAGGLLIIAGDTALTPTAGTVERFLNDLGMEVAAIRTTGQSGKQAVATLEQRPSAQFAVLLVEGDGPAGATFELGYLVGRLGLSRVCVLCASGTAGPSADAHGVTCLPLDTAGGWHLQLVRHLKRGGVEVDLNKLC